MRLAVDIAITLVLCIAISEGVLRIPALLAASQGNFRHGAVRAVISSEERAPHRVVCLGDSFTFGSGVDAGEAYPAALAERLEILAPGRFEVINFGVTALDSATARARLEALLARVEPESIVLWVGSNDRSIRDEPDAASSLEGVLVELGGSSRLALLLGSELQNRRLQRMWARELERMGPGLRPRHPPPRRVPAEARARAETNLGEIADRLRAAGVGLVLLSYPVGHSPVANQAIEGVAAERGIPLVATSESIQRLPKAQRNYLWAGHPNSDMHREIARDVADALLRQLD